MKTTLKSLILCAIAALSSVAAYAAPAQKDSIIITFGDKTRMIIYGEDRKELDKLMKYDLNSLLADLGARLDTMKGETKIYFEDIDGRKYMKDSADAKDKNYVRIGLRGIRIKDGDTEVTITTRGVDIKDGSDRVRVGGDRDDRDRDYDRDSRSGGIDTTARDGEGRRGDYDADYDNDGDRVMRIRRVRRYSSPRRGFNVALGLNTYSQNEPGSFNAESYDLRPFGSRYISLGFVKSATLARGKNAGLHLDFGLDVAWNNLMFEGNNTIEKGQTAVSFPLILDNEAREVDVRKTKLTVPYVNFSLMPTVSFPGSFISYISAGGYVGYRLGGYSKIKYPDGKKDKERSNYYLNDFRYGAAFELGIKNFPDFFVHYDMNNLFQDNRGPAVRMINFGIRF
ncbi:outer membrane beta-barrel protein [Persicitalea sp.]|uniref:outer membrane beta-barrel protein n=1 Tax=Persicitalea sp. TaxID=3100273 RepID=UPI0035942F2D